MEFNPLNEASMLQQLDQVSQWQREAAGIKRWLTDNPAADQAAIAEQRRRLKEVLNHIANSKK